MNIGPVHFRLRDYADEDGIIVKVAKWFPIAETPKGYWIVDEYDFRYFRGDETASWAVSLLKRHRKWTPKEYPRAFNPDLKLAVLSFRNRKAVQLRKLEWQMQQARQVDSFLKNLEDGDVTEAGFNCGTPSEWAGLRWE